jgi:hypothetical protein
MENLDIHLEELNQKIQYLEMVCNDRKQENGIFMLMVYKFRISLGGV